MMRYEVKKVFSRTSSKIAVLVLFLVMGVTCCFALDISYVDEEGNTQRGLDAVSKLKSAQKEWAGELDEKKISQVIALHEPAGAENQCYGSQRNPGQP